MSGGVLGISGVNWSIPVVDSISPDTADPFSSGFCWLLLFQRREWGRILASGGWSAVMGVGKLKKLAFDYELSEDLLSACRVDGAMYHITRVPFGEKVFGATKAISLLELDYHPVGGKVRFMEEVRFGGKYENWNSMADIKARGSWIDVASVGEMIRIAFGEPFDKSVHREAIRSAIRNVFRRDVVDYDIRFPADGVYAANEEGSFSKIMQTITLAAEYKDSVKDDKSKALSSSSTAKDSDSVRFDYNDALVAFGKGVGSLLQDLGSGIGVYNRLEFERSLGLKWVGDDSSASVDAAWSNFTPNVHAMSVLPWFNALELRKVHDVLRGKSVAVTTDRNSIGIVLRQAMLLGDNTPYAYDRHFTNVSGAYGNYVSMVYGDWSNKFVTLFLVAGFRDQTKDTKVKFKDETADTIGRDANDMIVSYRNALRRIESQLVSRDGVFDAKSFVRRFGLRYNGEAVRMSINRIFADFVSRYPEIPPHDIYVQKPFNKISYLTNPIHMDTYATNTTAEFFGVKFYCYVKTSEPTDGSTVITYVGMEFNLPSSFWTMIDFIKGSTGKKPSFAEGLRNLKARQSVDSGFGTDVGRGSSSTAGGGVNANGRERALSSATDSTLGSNVTNRTEKNRIRKEKQRLKKEGKLPLQKNKGVTEVGNSSGCLDHRDDDIEVITDTDQLGQNNSTIITDDVIHPKSETGLKTVTEVGNGSGCSERRDDEIESITDTDQLALDKSSVITDNVSRSKSEEGLKVENDNSGISSSEYEVKTTDWLNSLEDNDSGKKE